ncbi:MAG: methyltransferase [Flavobacteriales bacterium]|nr:methyltransferase [Flavobacteriales bacterium]
MHPVLRRWYAWYGRSPRRHRYDGLDLIVLPGVFHPGLFFSTHTLADFICGMDLKGRTFLELGAGTGLIALLAARLGADATASDINPAALHNLELNRERTGLPLHIVRSDLFDDLPGHFDVIAINPPYYSRDPDNDAERAFFAGRDLDHFRRSFPSLSERVRAGTEVYMVLSGDLDLHPIWALAKGSGLRAVTLHERSRWGEPQVVFQLVREDPSTMDRANRPSHPQRDRTT